MSEGKLCRIPWHDGTDRFVPVGTVVETEGETRAIADEGGWQYLRRCVGDKKPIPWGILRVALVLTVAPEPPAVGIDPESLTEWVWCLIREEGDEGRETVRQVREGMYRSWDEGSNESAQQPFPSRWTILRTLAGPKG